MHMFVMTQSKNLRSMMSQSKLIADGPYPLNSKNIYINHQKVDNPQRKLTLVTRDSWVQKCFSILSSSTKTTLNRQMKLLMTLFKLVQQTLEDYCTKTSHYQEVLLYSKDLIQGCRKVSNKEQMEDWQNMQKWQEPHKPKCQQWFNKTWCNNLLFGLEVVIQEVKKDLISCVNLESNIWSMARQFVDIMLFLVVECDQTIH